MVTRMYHKNNISYHNVVEYLPAFKQHWVTESFIYAAEICSMHYIFRLHIFIPKYSGTCISYVMGSLTIATDKAP